MVGSRVGLGSRSEEAEKQGKTEKQKAEKHNSGEAKKQGSREA
jgi:hypothetical protein